LDLIKWREGLNLSLKNAIQLRDDGDLLMKKGSLGHAYFSFYSALEELGVALYIISHYNDLPDLKNSQNFFKSHKEKTALMIFDYFKSANDEIELKKEFYFKLQKTGKSFDYEYSRLIDKHLKIWKNRNWGVYTSLNENLSDWSSPKRITNEDLLMIRRPLYKAIEDFSNTISRMKNWNWF
jgi:AbiV family abortive infection protein